MRPDATEQEILRLICEAQRYGVNIISYADPSGGINILGPKISEQVVNDFTVPLLKKIEELPEKNLLVALCPKTRMALQEAGRAMYEDIPLTGRKTYGEACIEMIGKTRFVGQTCVKNTRAVLEDGNIKSVRLLEKESLC